MEETAQKVYLSSHWDTPELPHPVTQQEVEFFSWTADEGRQMDRTVGPKETRWASSATAMALDAFLWKSGYGTILDTVMIIVLESW